LKNRNVTIFTVGTVSLFIIVFFLGTYIRNGGSNILLATSLGALPTGFTIIVISYMLRNADKRIQLVWCSVVMILIRSVHLWRPGIDFGQEAWFIKSILDYFQKGILSGYLKLFPANIPFAAIFYVFYLIWHDVETFELLVFFVYPLLVVGYYFMAKEIMKLYRTSSTPILPAIMFFSIIPTLANLPPFYWPSVLGLGVLFFSCATLFHLLSSESGKSRQWVILIALSTTLVFSHSISTALFILTIFLLYLTCGNRAKRWILLRIGLFTSLMFTVAQYDYYSKYLRLIIFAIQGDIKAWQDIMKLSFTNIDSVFRTGPIMTLAHTGLFIIVGLLILLRAYRLLNHKFIITMQSKKLLVEWLTLLKSDTIVFLYVGFSVLSFIFAVFLGGSFLDPVRLMSWVSLCVLPVIIPSKKPNALLLMVILLVLFFLLIWTVNSPWGYLYGSVHGLNLP
jgi:hypothetical protein